MKSIRFWRMEVQQLTLTERIFFRDAISTLMAWGSLNEEFRELALIRKVLESEIKEYNEYFEYNIQSILIVYGDFGIHDEIIVYDNLVTLNKPDRELIIKTNKVKTILGIQH